MSDELLVKHCSPTLAGIKTGNIFLVAYDELSQLQSDLRKINQRLKNKGLRILPIRFHEGKVLLYLYRPKSLSKDFRNEEVRQLLIDLGYTDISPDQCIIRLIDKMKDPKSFPHEIGLFLSYPPEDVRGFIENHAANFKMSGLWKVYGDTEKAKQTFSRFNKCTNIYSEQLALGKTIEQLTVTV